MMTCELDMRPQIRIRNNQDRKIKGEVRKMSCGRMRCI